MPIAAIGLGANLPSTAGAPPLTLAAAIKQLGEHGHVIAQSSLYRTAPVGYLDQPDFLNAAALLDTALAPQRLLAVLLGIERGFGRDRSAAPPKGPRTLDLDLLLYHDFVLNEHGLTVPHPAMHMRGFVLAPLAEIAPAWRHPVLQRTIAELRAALPADGSQVAKISE